MPPLSGLAARRDHLVVCGDDALAARVIEELTTTYGEEVTVLVGPGSGLDGAAVQAVHRTGLVQLLAVEPAGGGPVNWPPAADLRLAAADRLYVIATRAGLSGILARSLPPR